MPMSRWLALVLIAFVALPACGVSSSDESTASDADALRRRRLKRPTPPPVPPASAPAAVLPGASAVSIADCDANSIYLATDGDDRNSGTFSAPLLTPQRAVDMTGPGSVVCFRGGTYAATTNPTNAMMVLHGHSGAPGSPITFRTYPGERVVLDVASSEFVFFGQNMTYVIIDGFEMMTSSTTIGRILALDLRNSADLDTYLREYASVVAPWYIWIDSTAPYENHDDVFQHLYIHDSTGVGIGGTFADTRFLNNETARLRNRAGYGYYVQGKGVTFAANISHGNSYGFHLYSGVMSAFEDSVFENNVVYDNGYPFWHSSGNLDPGRGLLIRTGANSIITNNVFFENTASQAGEEFSCSGCKVYNNTFANDVADFRDYANDARNNTFYRTSVLGESATSFSNNLCDADGTGCTIVGDPLFVDLTGHDFHVAAGSPAVDGGQCLAEVPIDFDRSARPAGAGCDVGAFER